MRIAVWHNLRGGGGRRALYEHLKGLASRGHSIEIWHPADADPAYLPLDVFGKCHPEPLRIKTPRSFSAFMSHGYANTLAMLHAVDEHCRRCADAINRGGFDVFFGNTCFHMAAAPVGRYVNLPRMLLLEEPRRSLYESLPSLPWLAPPSSSTPCWYPRRIRRLLENTMAVHALRIQSRNERDSVLAYSRVLTSSRYSREVMLRVYGIDAHICPRGVDTSVFRPTGAPRERVVLASGHLSYVKRPDRAIRAIAAIPAARRPPLIWMGHLGGGPFQEQTLDLAKQLGVAFLPRIGLADDEIVAELNRAAVILCTTQLEPLGLAPLEANACETPAVAIAEAGFRETILDGVNGTLVESADPTVMADALLRYLDDPDYARQIGRSARDHVLSHYSWDTANDVLERHLLAVARGLSDI